MMMTMMGDSEVRFFRQNFFLLLCRSFSFDGGCELKRQCDRFAGLPDFYWYNIPKWENYTKLTLNIPKVKKYTIGQKIY
jgi:hypothetical protein